LTFRACRLFSWSTELEDNHYRFLALQLILAVGFLSGLGASFTAPFLPLYALALGATRRQIGLMNGLPFLPGTLFQLLGAKLAERLPNRKRWIFVLTGGTMGGLAMIGYALIPEISAGAVAVWMLITLYTWAAIWGHTGLPAWNVLFTEAMPRPIWGRFWADYNIAASMITVVATASAGWMINKLGEPTGYQVGALISFTVNACTLYIVIRIPEEQLQPRDEETLARWKLGRGFLGILKEDRDFVLFCLVGALLNLSNNLSAPQLPVFWVQGLKASAGTVGLLNAVGVVTTLIGWRFYGSRVDRGNPKRIMVISGIWSAIMTLAWLLATQMWHAFPLRVLSVMATMGWLTAGFSFIRAMAPPQQLGSYLALQTMFYSFPGFVGAALSGVVAERLGFGANFVLSSLFALLGVLVFARWVGDPFATRIGPGREATFSA
jgi:MFS family permease